LTDEHGDDDPHFWLNPTLAKIMVDNICNEIILLDKQNEKFYKTNSDEYKKQLDILDSEMKDILKNAKRDILVFGGEFAYSYFLSKYNIKYETAYLSAHGESEPSPAVINRLYNYVKTNKIPVVMREEFDTDNIAKAIANGYEGCEVLVFSTIHNISKDEFDKGISFIDKMKENIKNVEKALN